MFSFFKKDKKIKYKDIVWMTNSSWIEGIKEQLKQPSKTICVVAFFEHTINELEQLLNDSGIEYRTVNSYNEIKDYPWAAIIRADRILASFSSLTDGTKSNDKQILFAEHYPIADYEQKVMEFFKKELAEVQFVFHTHFDQDLMTYFGSDRIRKFMEQIGEANEAMEHPLILKAIANAQKKIASKVHHEQKCNSAADWFKTNMRD